MNSPLYNLFNHLCSSILKFQFPSFQIEFLKSIHNILLCFLEDTNNMSYNISFILFTVPEIICSSICCASCLSFMMWLSLKFGFIWLCVYLFENPVTFLESLHRLRGKLDKSHHCGLYWYLVKVTVKERLGCSSRGVSLFILRFSNYSSHYP